MSTARDIIYPDTPPIWPPLRLEPPVVIMGTVIPGEDRTKEGGEDPPELDLPAVPGVPIPVAGWSGPPPGPPAGIGEERRVEVDPGDEAAAPPRQFQRLHARPAGDIEDRRRRRQAGHGGERPRRRGVIAGPLARQVAVNGPEGVVQHGVSLAHPAAASAGQVGQGRRRRAAAS